MIAGMSVVQPGVFVRPSGAQLRSSLDETALVDVWNETGECFGYAKPDGWRFQIHKQGEEIKLFSRSGKDWIKEFPLVAEMIRTQIKCTEIILDTEVVGFDRQNQHLCPSDLHSASTYLCYVLDALYLNGYDLTEEPTIRRIELLRKEIHHACYGGLIFSNYTHISSLEGLANFYHECLRMRERGFDGAIIKRLDIAYFTDVLKIKPMDTLDAAVLGAYYNSERIVNKLLLALPSSSDKSWKPVAKAAGSGSNWEAVLSACQPYMTTQRPRNLDYVHQKPHIWVKPAVVVAIQMTELRLGRKNYLLYAQAPRNCVLREDKGPYDATTFEQAYKQAAR